jgi:alpha-tubulin suppressor-like RCC1 family protein
LVQVACTALNTCAVTNAGELYITGSNTYNQTGTTVISDDPRKPVEESKSFVLVTFFKESYLQVKQVACGAEHLFATTFDNEVFAWGRNDSG